MTKAPKIIQKSIETIVYELKYFNVNGILTEVLIVFKRMVNNFETFLLLSCNAYENRYPKYPHIAIKTDIKI